MTVYNDRLWCPYGDYDTNRGPVDIVSVGPAGDIQIHYPQEPAKKFSTWQYGKEPSGRAGGINIPSEATEVYRVIDGFLYVPWTDPLWHWDGPGGYTTDAPDGILKNVEIDGPRMLHCYDMAGLNGDLYICGSSAKPDDRHQSNGVVLRSTDGGDTWTNVFTTDTSWPGSNRIYSIIESGGALWVPVNDMDTFTIDNWRSTDGINWEKTDLPWPVPEPTGAIRFPDGKSRPAGFAVKMGDMYYASGEDGKIWMNETLDLI